MIMVMAAQTQTSPLSVDEYLKTQFEGSGPEYLDGELVERNVPNYAHGRTQCCLGALLKSFGQERPLYAATELHLRVATGRYRIADVAVFEGEEPAEGIPSQPPLVVIEILSPNDSAQDVLAKFEELHAWGVKHLWLANPGPRRLYVYDGGLREVPAFTIPEYKIEIAAATVFA